MMKWEELLKSHRLGCNFDASKEDINRSEFLRDYDRIIFSPAFRRLHGKTQVFPFPETDIIHTRLTHSLETCSVGRSLGTIVGNSLRLEKYNIGSLVSAACIAHDIGNPPLGHSGENAIAEFFTGEFGQEVLNGLSIEQKEDFVKFDGNAMGFYLLTNSNPNITKVEGGLGLTYPTLAAFTKYPRPAYFDSNTNSRVSEKKPGLFSCSLHVFEQIANELGIPQKTKGNCWYRHPLAFLTEAADDICNCIIDLEDGYKHKLVSYEETHELLTSIINACPDKGNCNNIDKIIDKRNKISYLRAKAINSLIYQSIDVFKKNEQEILNGVFDQPLILSVKSKDIVRIINDISKKKIYSYDPVIQTEAAGFEVLPGLLETFFLALLDNKKSSSKKILSLVPKDLLLDNKEQKYTSIMNIVGYVAGMTDSYAVNLYRMIKGIQLPNF